MTGGFAGPISACAACGSCAVAFARGCCVTGASVLTGCAVVVVGLRGNETKGWAVTPPPKLDALPVLISDCSGAPRVPTPPPPGMSELKMTREAGGCAQAAPPTKPPPEVGASVRTLTDSTP